MFWDSIKRWFWDDHSTCCEDISTCRKGIAEVNPATGLLMVGGIGGVDTAGNPYGANLHRDFDSFHSGFDSFDSGFDSFHSGFDSDW